jgi:methylthioribose-1-phosphate isomerase
LRIVDQTMLPGEIRYLELETLDAVAQAIQTLKVRGAPLIGIVAAYGAALVARSARSSPFAEFKERVLLAVETLGETRPTAVNLFEALRRVREVLERSDDPASAALAIEDEALRFHREERERCRAIGENGASLIPEGARILTVCNTGPLATGGEGTALGVIAHAHRKGRVERVYVAETRPLLQGARLTMLELRDMGIPGVLIPDGASGAVMSREGVNAVVVGADRIARNGDTANKIGTLNLAVLAGYFRCPFYVAAPTSTIDRDAESGGEIPLERRAEEEVLECAGQRIAPEGSRALNMAFDVTPNDLITAIITEKGVLRPPYETSIGEIE